MQIYAVYLQETLNPVACFKFDHYAHFGYFQQYHIREIANEYIKILDARVEQLPASQLTQLTNIGIDSVTVYAYHQANQRLYIVCDETITHTMIRDFTIKLIQADAEPTRTALVTEFNQDPTRFVSPIKQVQQVQQETMEVMVANVEKLLERGESMENLLRRSATLSQDSFEMSIRAREMNACCTIL